MRVAFGARRPYVTKGPVATYPGMSLGLPASASPSPSDHLPPGFLAWVTEIVRAHRARLLGYARRRGLEGDDALDAVQDAFAAFLTLSQARSIARDGASAEGFLDQPGVLDGASEVFVHALGERGRHARTAFAPGRLPRDNSIELVVTFAYEREGVR